MLTNKAVLHHSSSGTLGQPEPWDFRCKWVFLLSLISAWLGSDLWADFHIKCTLIFFFFAFFKSFSSPFFLDWAFLAEVAGCVIWIKLVWSGKELTKYMSQCGVIYIRSAAVPWWMSQYGEKDCGNFCRLPVRHRQVVTPNRINKNTHFTGKDTLLEKREAAAQLAQGLAKCEKESLFLGKVKWQSFHGCFVPTLEAWKMSHSPFFFGILPLRENPVCKGKLDEVNNPFLRRLIVENIFKFVEINVVIFYKNMWPFFAWFQMKSNATPGHQKGILLCTSLRIDPHSYSNPWGSKYIMFFSLLLNGLSYEIERKLLRFSWFYRTERPRGILGSPKFLLCKKIGF